MKTLPYFKRQIYIERIQPFINSPVIKVISGQRRVGKSYLLFQLIEQIKELYPLSDIIYINKELFDFDAIKNYSDLINYVSENRRNKSEKCFLFIDEIQDISEFEKALRHFFAEYEYDIYCTGSNANLLSGELATFLSGRYIEFKVFSLSYVEFLEFHQLVDNNESFEKFYKFGGLPYLINLPLEEKIISEYLHSIFNTIVLKDVVERYKVRNVRSLNDLVNYIADTTGSMFSSTSISEYLKSQRIDMQPKTILEYLDYLSKAYLLQRIRPVDMQGKEIFRIGEKYYFEDLGIRHAIRPFRPNDISKVLENLVCHHLSMHGYQLSIGRNKDKEIDFIAEKSGERIYVQVAATLKMSTTREREFGNLLAIKDNYPKMVVTLDNETGISYQGILQIPIRKFLLEYK